MPNLKHTKDTSQSLKRFGAIYVISFVAIGLIQPHHGNVAVAGGAIVPAFIAWLIVRKKPVSFLRAILRGSSIVFSVAGFMALGIAPDGAEIGTDATGAGGLPLKNWAAAFLAFGLMGLFGSFVGERKKNDLDGAG